MVKLLFLFLLIATPLMADDEPTDIKFIVQFSKTQVYVGEQILCHFILFTHESSLDVEVVKFPEFKGFWKENLSLRQGPLPTMPYPDGRVNHVMIGSYLLTAMSHSSETAAPSIQPMKIVVRRDGTAPSEANRTYLSEGPALKIKTLPPLPKDISENQFTGAVGNFSQWVVDRSLIFTPKEPVLIRFQLTGQGNFPEISTLPIVWPEGVKVLSEKNQTWGSVSHSTKTFEYTVVVEKNEPVTIAVPDLAYFSPDEKKWRTMKAPEVTLSPRPAAAEAESLPEPPPAFLFEKTFSLATPWYLSPFLWILNGLLLVTSIILVVQRKKKEVPVVVVKKEDDAEQLTAEVEALFHRGEMENYLRKAYLLSQKGFAKDNHVQKIKTTYEYYFFSGTKEWKVSPQEVRENLRALRK